MQCLDAHTTADYLRRSGRVSASAQVVVQRLEGGVSNEVLRVQVVDGGQTSEFVLKQARAKLRTPQDWFCTVERIWRETAVLAICARLAAPGEAPELLFEDRQNFLFAMSAAPPSHRTWKRDLLDGQCDLGVAQACGRLLGRLHAGSWRDPAIGKELGDRQLFDELRLDPYYRAVARMSPQAAGSFDRAIASLEKNACSLVHGDFSPKNILLWNKGLMLVDYETGHYGDPAFDLGFFFSHLLLKAFYHAPRQGPMLEAAEAAFEAYRGEVEPKISPADWQSLAQRWTQHLGACIWARLDGKSQIEYLVDPQARAAARRLGQELLNAGDAPWKAALARTLAILVELPD